TIVMDITDAQEILGVAKGYVTDLAVYIPNKEEIDTIATKIQSLAPNVKIITHQQLISKYETLYHYKGGIFLVVFLIALLTFFIVVSDKLSGISSSEQHEIATLKALGWSMQDIIKEKFLESFILSFGAYLFGIIIALWYVYIIQAPLLDQIFEGESGIRPPFALLFHFDVTTFVMIFFITVPVYIASVILPTWRVAAMEIDEVLR
ncbi:MAG: FtsX-like permease family protein, partial [Epsilonproteobacteria bacterium]|nr:FtsX-like permease family protein [Campylobacterota bacterium]